MLALTAPRVHALNAPYYRQTGLDGSAVRAQRRRDRGAVQGGRHLTRDDLSAALRDAGIPADGLRLALLLMHAELEAVVCNGPRRGKQFTYAALDERAPAARALAARRSAGRAGAALLHRSRPGARRRTSPGGPGCASPTRRQRSRRSAPRWRAGAPASDTYWAAPTAASPAAPRRAREPARAPAAQLRRVRGRPTAITHRSWRRTTPRPSAFAAASSARRS